MNKAIFAAAATAAALALAPPAANAAGPVRIGFVATMTGNGAIVGRDIRDGFEFGLAELGGKLGGLDTEITYADDAENPNTGRQVVDKLIEVNKVQLITGFSNSAVLLATARPILHAGVFLVGANAGPSQLAGKECNENYFSTSWQNDASSEAMGQYVTSLGVKDAYLMAPNFPAGKDKLAGFKRYFKGKIDAEVYTPFGQSDYASALAELRRAKPTAMYFFYYGSMGINFIKQLDQSGLKKDIQVFSEMAGIDQEMLPAVGKAAVGMKGAVFWSSTLDNPQNKAFVEGFEKKYHRIPSPYTAQGYDTAKLLDAALRESHGLDNKDAFRAAMMKADFKSVRGYFAFGKNHFPIEDWYLATPEEIDGKLRDKILSTIFTHHGDAYVSQCPMAKQG
ncbi:MAG TPA: ABC transporter substrate-binding protein [Hyphomicrobiales bacterium]|nr:ABC transporter substrate-binding protein [Hyphomicrobiales bacterium]